MVYDLVILMLVTGFNRGRRTGFGLRDGEGGFSDKQQLGCTRDHGIVAVVDRAVSPYAGRARYSDC